MALTFTSHDSLIHTSIEDGSAVKCYINKFNAKAQIYSNDPDLVQIVEFGVPIFEAKYTEFSGSYASAKAACDAINFTKLVYEPAVTILT